MLLKLLFFFYFYISVIVMMLHYGVRSGISLDVLMFGCCWSIMIGAAL